MTAHTSEPSDGSMPRPLTDRERSVLDALLAAEFDGVADLREQAKTVVVGGICGCGCPSIDFDHSTGERGTWVRVNAGIRDSHGDGLFLYTMGPWLGGIEYVGVGETDPREFPDSSLLTVTPAS
ncbi:hypothetical protein [Promicromonospora panici]|uniref:hypothetical protein n=1 Tax=Promicromonospora panici TaxID=2219658 RepID=UPI001A936042|nr:hypothetical protein [Promicromonospora panici]